jgi:hypothetical protein
MKTIPIKTTRFLMTWSGEPFAQLTEARRLLDRYNCKAPGLVLYNCAKDQSVMMVACG